MDLAHNKVTQEEAAKNLLVKINKVRWRADRIAILRDNDGTHWVYMIIIDDQSGNRQEYLVERLGMIKSWLALDNFGQKLYKHLQIQMNNKKWIAQDVEKEKDDNGLVWIEIIMKDEKSDEMVSISIERQGMIDAYYALRLKVGDMFESGIDALEAFNQLLHGD